jgi:dipeptidyl aminopeptidase/acylaminoacyl peptidase
MLPLPQTPSSSTTHPKLDKRFTTPYEITHDKAASGIQPLFTGRLIFTQSSFTSPNEVFIVRNLPRLTEALIQGADLSGLSADVEQITKLTEGALKDKKLSVGEEYWFKGAEEKDVQGWILKPRGFKEGEKKKWPVLLAIHGGPQGAWEDQWSNRWNPNGLF